MAGSAKHLRILAAVAAGTFAANATTTRCDAANATSVEPEWAYVGPEAPTLPYFSAAGQAYAEKLRLPRPPFFRHGSTEEVDPPRNTPAAAWNGPFCKAWTDDCTICTRGADGHPSCAQAPGKEASCTRHAVTCTTTGFYPDDFAYQHCRLLESYRIERTHGRDRDVWASQAAVLWYLARRDHRWHFYIGEDAYLPRAPRPGERPPRPEHIADDWRCIEAIGTPRTPYDAGIELDPVIER